MSRLGFARTIVGPGDIRRHVSVRMAFADDRAKAMLDSEAGQLAKDAPGLIMAGVGSATGASKTWEPALTRRFQPQMHTRVGCVFLWFGGMCLTPGGVDQFFSTKLIMNPHAKLPLPRWITDALGGIGDEFKKIEEVNAG